MSFRDEKHGEVSTLLAGGRGTFFGIVVIRQVEVPIEETLTVAHGDRLLLIDTQDVGDVVPIQLEIRDHSQVVKALQGHQQNKAYGSDFFHDLKI